MQYLSVSEIEYVAHTLAKELMSWNEPIPDFQTRYPNKLEACMAAPQQTFDKKQLYPTIYKKGSILFYLIIKDHPFQNGNKRIAIMTLLYFLHKNRKWLKIDNQRLYNFARWVAASDPAVKEQVLGAIYEILRKHSARRDVFTIQT